MTMGIYYEAVRRWVGDTTQVIIHRQSVFSAHICLLRSLLVPESPSPGCLAQVAAMASTFVKQRRSTVDGIARPFYYSERS